MTSIKNFAATIEGLYHQVETQRVSVINVLVDSPKAGICIYRDKKSEYTIVDFYGDQNLYNLLDATVNQKVSGAALWISEDASWITPDIALARIKVVDIQNSKKSLGGVKNEEKSLTPQKPAGNWQHWGEGYSGKSYTAWADRCAHNGNMPIIEGVWPGTLYGGGWTRGAKPETDWAVIDLTGTEYKGTTIDGKNLAGKEAFASFIEAAQFIHVGPWLSFYIQDFGVPKEISIDRWEALAEAVRGLLASGTNVLVACTGGHGRTGLVLSILVGLLLPDDEAVQADPIAWIRKVHCNEAVETSDQERYIYAILGKTELFKQVKVIKELGSWEQVNGVWAKKESDPKKASGAVEEKTAKSEKTNGEGIRVDSHYGSRWYHGTDGGYYSILDNTIVGHLDDYNCFKSCDEPMSEVGLEWGMLTSIDGCPVCGLEDCADWAECSRCKYFYHLGIHDSEEYCLYCRSFENTTIDLPGDTEK